MNRIPTPAAIRALVVAAVGVATVAIGHQIDTAWVEPLIGVYAALIPAIAYLVKSPLHTAAGDDTQGE
ncbi:hypothetical protein [Nocardia terpenica]|uniref:Holin n=1 Tax=Nocardia terpenica TaxID=455432 RepID=A0A164HUH7_9NOCA|nr:hypothetical protein [Nocardia terpenica]KZM68826.1 hypothetical protein AWN90_13635 [Nocardia terpenica]NQE88133.1 hypothetical protein [Nocardia terpenica]